MKKENVWISAGVSMKVDVGSPETCSVLAEVNDLHDRVDAALRQVEVVEGPPIDIALRREGEAPTPTRDLIFAYDGLLADLSRHLVGMEVAVCPLVAQRLPDGTRTVRGYLVRARQMETTMRHIEQLLGGDARAPSRRLDLLHQELLEQMAQHRQDEARMVATLESMLTPEQYAALAVRVELATRKAPTRPHPSVARRLSWTRMLYRPVAGFDRLLDTLDSRRVPRLGAEPPRRRIGLWGSYLVGLPPEHEDTVAAPAARSTPPRH